MKMRGRSILFLAFLLAGERDDLLAREPGRVAALQGAWDAWAATLPEPLWGAERDPKPAPRAGRAGAR